MTASAAYPGDEDVFCHVVPLGDFRQHELSRACWCHPKPDEQVPEVMIHNAMDQRERLERGEIYIQ